MNLKARVADVLARVTLLQRFAVTSFVMILVLGVVIAYSLGRSIEAYAPVQHQIDQTEIQVYSMLGAGLVLLYLFLFGIVRQGSKTIATQRQAVLQYTADLEESYNATIASLGAAVDARDSTTEEHAERVRDLSVALARWLGWSEEEVQQMERGAALHDVGKIGISDTILLKPDALTVDEWEEMRRHPEIGHQMLKRISFLQNALPVVRHHHERWDGRGYPDGLRGEEIPLPARLFAVIDAYDAITTDRPYRRSAPHEVALELILQKAGTHFDPKMAVAFVTMMRERMPVGPVGPHLVAS